MGTTNNKEVIMKTSSINARPARIIFVYAVVFLVFFIFSGCVKAKKAEPPVAEIIP